MSPLDSLLGDKLLWGAIVGTGSLSKGLQWWFGRRDTKQTKIQSSITEERAAIDKKQTEAYKDRVDEIALLRRERDDLKDLLIKCQAQLFETQSKMREMEERHYKELRASEMRADKQSLVSASLEMQMDILLMTADDKTKEDVLRLRKLQAE